MKTLTYLPVFGGFYGGYFDITEMCSNYESNEGEDMNEDLANSFDYGRCTTEISKLCVDKIEDKLLEYDLIKSIKFVSLTSPKCYNYSNDSINIEVEFNSKKIKAYLAEHEDDFSEYISDNCTSYDGFISYHSNDYKDWVGNDSLKDTHRLGLILNFILNKIAESDVDFPNYETEPWLYNEVMYESDFYLGEFYQGAE